MFDKDIIGILGWLSFFLIVVGLPVYLNHRRAMAKIQVKSAPQDSAEIEKLRERCDALEKRCTKLEEQVTEAHSLLADEQRQLDKKLSNILPGESQPQSPGERRRDVPSKTVM